MFFSSAAPSPLSCQSFARSGHFVVKTHFSGLYHPRPKLPLCSHRRALLHRCYSQDSQERLSILTLTYQLSQAVHRSSCARHDLQFRPRRVVFAKICTAISKHDLQANFSTGHDRGSKHRSETATNLRVSQMRHALYDSTSIPPFHDCHCL